MLQVCEYADASKCEALYVIRTASYMLPRKASHNKAIVIIANPSGVLAPASESAHANVANPATNKAAATYLLKANYLPYRATPTSITGTTFELLQMI